MHDIRVDLNCQDQRGLLDDFETLSDIGYHNVGEYEGEVEKEDRCQVEEEKDSQEEG